MYQRVFFAGDNGDLDEGFGDLDLREWLTIIPLLVIALWIGLVPQPFLDRIQPTVDRVTDQVSVALPGAVAVTADDPGPADDGPEGGPAEVED
jgi:NADH-quinone oxidoreductase subunit M